MRNLDEHGEEDYYKSIIAVSLTLKIHPIQNYIDF